MPRSATPSSAGFVRASPRGEARDNRASACSDAGARCLVHAEKPGSQVMFQVALYDLIYKSMKDYAAEAAQIAEQARRARPHCRTPLDGGCGTWERARLLG